MPLRRDLAARVGAVALLASIAALLAGCMQDEPGPFFGARAEQPLSPQMLALMQEKGTTPSAPMLIRTYKQTAEFEVWKMRWDGQYALLKTYPMCRWSGQLGPKTHEGDRQVPEGFYTITPAQMNPNSNYYLSFNVGYPNAYDRAHGASGESIMVHGACSSAGCFSMTDAQIAEIYALAREAFAGGQREIQMQSLPFHMTPENFAKYRLDPNIAFWKELKTGTDNFEVTKQEVAVGVCDGHYVFNARPASGGFFDADGPCPPLARDQMVEDEVLAKQKRDDAQIAELVAEGVRPVHTVYADGGQNPAFASMRGDVSRPDALAEGPVDVAIDARRKTPSLAQLHAAESKDLAEASAADRKAARLRETRAAAEGRETQDGAEPVADAQPPAPPAAQPAQNTSIFDHLFHGPQTQPALGPTQTATASQPVQQDASQQPAAPPNEMNFSHFYQETQPSVSQPAATETADSPSADSSDEDTGQASEAPAPPSRKETQDAATGATPSTSGAAQQPQQAQAAASQSAAAQPPQQGQTLFTDDTFGGAAAFLKQGFSALTPSQ